jgi:hypothetical protein
MRESMDLEARKLSFVQEFLRIQDEDIIIGLEKLLRKEKAKWVEENLKPMTKEEYQSEVDKAMEDSEKGRMTKASELKEKIKEWR